MRIPPSTAHHTASRCRAGTAIPLALAGLLTLAAAWVACKPRNEAPLLADGVLVVLTRNAPTTYYENRSGEPTGLEHDLTLAFARSLNLRVEFKVLDGVDEILEALRRGEGHLAAAGLTRTEEREREFIIGPAYQSIQELVVCRKGVAVAELADLVGKEVIIIADSSYEESLEEVRRDHPELTWATTRHYSTEQLLRQVWEGRIDCTVADSNIVALNRKHFPELEAPLALGGETSLVWLLNRDSAQLAEPLETWLAAYRDSGRLRAQLDKYYGYVAEFDYYDTKVFFARVDERLPRYRPLFEEAEMRHGVPWQLLAAISYQESHWDPQAVSPTGVRGLMMLTRTTAEQMGVSNRLDPEQSVLAGARYLRRLTNRIPPYIESPDRVWMALAAYNVGFGHLQDARMLAVELGENPNRWHGVKEVLPYLSQKKYYRRLRHGYARGHEPVIFVQRVRNYYNLLRAQVQI